MIVIRKEDIEDKKEYNIRRAFENRIRYLSYFVIFIIILSFFGIVVIALDRISSKGFNAFYDIEEIIKLLTVALWTLFIFFVFRVILQGYNNKEQITKPSKVQFGFKSLLLIFIAIPIIAYYFKKDFLWLTVTIPEIYFLIVVVKIFHYYKAYAQHQEVPMIEDHDGQLSYVLFDNWDPIKAYGRFIIIKSTFYLFFCGYLNYKFDSQELWIVHLFCLFSIVSACLFSLKKELGRIFMIFHHVLWPIMSIYLAWMINKKHRGTSFEDLFDPNWIILTIWVYFVIKSLCTKAMKHVFMFGNYYDREIKVANDNIS